MPAAPLATGRTYSIYISYNARIADVAGNLLATYNYSFTTGFTANTSAPQVSGVSPVNGLTQVPLNAHNSRCH